MLTSLQAGEPYGGPVETAFSSRPILVDMFLHQKNPLLSVQFFPIFINGQWWGLVGFDDCTTVRHWDEREISLLGTASEMIGNTLLRWQAEAQLYETLANLEAHVQERTHEFIQANSELRHEIHERERFQSELEERLDIESILARISTRLLSPMQLDLNIHETLSDLGQMMQASRVVFIQLADLSTDMIDDIYEWYAPGTLPLSTDRGSYLNTTHPWFRNQFDSKKAIYIYDLPAHPEIAQIESELLIGREVVSLLLFPIFADNRLAGVIICSNPDLPAYKISENSQTGEVVASMLGSLLDREGLLRNLEEKVTERTRELSAFFDLAMLSADAQEISDIMQPALVKIMEINSCEAALIYIYEPDQQILQLVAQRGFTKSDFSLVQTICLDELMIAWMEGIGTGNGLTASDHTVTPGVFVFPRFHAVTYVSLRARDRIQGLLSCYRLAEIPFNPYQVTLLSAIGEQLGMAVENYRLRLEAEELATVQERQRMARELHDAVSQSLYSLVLFARSGRDALEIGDQVKLLDSLEQVESNSLAALKEMRLLLYQLRSLALEEGGLVRAIESRFNLVERRSGIQADFKVDANIKLSGRVEQELFRLITEALNNTLKHAGASQVCVSLELMNGQIYLVISDNGRGFDPSQVVTGMGLQNMRERATMLEGALK